MRLEYIASLINNANLVVDIGSDHAKLSKLLIDNQKANFVINIEKNLNPLNNSINATKDQKYANKIKNIQSDGFINLKQILKIDYCCICGMGTKTILTILNSSKKQKIKNFIIQTNTNSYGIRNWALRNCWKVKQDLYFKENNIIYEIIILSKHKGYIPLLKSTRYLGKNFTSQLFYEKWTHELLKLNFLNSVKHTSTRKKLLKIIKKRLK